MFAGYEPATDLVQGLADCDEQGYIVTDRAQKTSCDGLYAAGDVCIKSLRQVVTAVGDGALAATELERFAAAMQKRTGPVSYTHLDVYKRQIRSNEEKDEKRGMIDIFEQPKNRRKICDEMCIRDRCSRWRRGYDPSWRPRRTWRP